MWLARYVDGTATMEGLIGPSRDKEGVRVLARSGVWLAGWRDPITGLLVALCGRGATENKPLILFQSDGETIAQLPQGDNIGDVSTEGVWGIQNLRFSDRSQHWTLHSWDGSPIIIGHPHDINAAKESKLTPLVSFADIRQQSIHDCFIEGSPWGANQPILAAALNENNTRNISVVKFDPSAPVASISKLLRVEEFFEEGVTKHILSTLSVLQDVMSSPQKN